MIVTKFHCKINILKTDIKHAIPHFFQHNDTNKRLKVRFQKLDIGQDTNMQCTGTITIFSVNGEKKVQKTGKELDFSPTFHFEKNLYNTGA
jgi:hypothetical protein